MDGGACTKITLSPVFSRQRVGSCCRLYRLTIRSLTALLIPVNLDSCRMETPSLCGQGRHMFYSLLCKCRLFTDRFDVPELTGVFMEET